MPHSYWASAFPATRIPYERTPEVSDRPTRCLPGVFCSSYNIFYRRPTSRSAAHRQPTAPSSFPVTLAVSAFEEQTKYNTHRQIDRRCDLPHHSPLGTPSSLYMLRLRPGPLCPVLRVPDLLLGKENSAPGMFSLLIGSHPSLGSVEISGGSTGRHGAGSSPRWHRTNPVSSDLPHSGPCCHCPIQHLLQLMVLLRRDVQCLCYQFSQGDIPRVVQTQDIFSGVEGVDRWPSIRAFILGKGRFSDEKIEYH